MPAWVGLTPVEVLAGQIEPYRSALLAGAIHLDLINGGERDHMHVKKAVRSLKFSFLRTCLLGR